MPEPGYPSLDQLKVLRAVVDAGSFAAAGRALGRATSAVSYTIANLERQLGVQLFDRLHTREPVLTDAGRVVLSRALAISIGVDDLRASVKGLLGGLEAEVSLVVDVMLPSDRLVDAVRAFEAQFPTVKLRLYVEALSAVSQLVQSGVATVGIGGLMHIAAPGIEQTAVGSVELIPVAAPSHPLAQKKVMHAGEVRRHRQLILTVRSSFAEQQDMGVFGDEAWRLADLGAKHALLIGGAGWGMMPEPMVRADIVAKRLVRLNVPETRGASYFLQAIYRTDNPPGPAAAWIIERFAGQAADRGATARRAAPRANGKRK
jgi:DNA-binding transcriptional LysR family regulator